MTPTPKAYPPNLLKQPRLEHHHDDDYNHRLNHSHQNHAENTMSISVPAFSASVSSIGVVAINGSTDSITTRSERVVGCSREGPYSWDGGGSSRSGALAPGEGANNSEMSYKNRSVREGSGEGVEGAIQEPRGGREGSSSARLGSQSPRHSGGVEPVSNPVGPGAGWGGRLRTSEFISRRGREGTVRVQYARDDCLLVSIIFP